MIKPTGYDEVQASGEFVPVTPGGHYCVIKRVDEALSSNGKPMVVVYFDFSGRDMQEGYFTKQFNEDTREDKKWPFVEKSNENFVTQWGDDWGEQFKGKQIGAVFGREESEFNGNVSMRCIPKWFCSVDAVADAKVPEDKYLNKPEPQKSAFEPIDANDLPF